MRLPPPISELKGRGEAVRGKHSKEEGVVFLPEEALCVVPMTLPAN